jgi:hypothetical protein
MPKKRITFMRTEGNRHPTHAQAKEHLGHLFNARRT